jgi:protoporphyrinogen IX oxidase
MYLWLKAFHIISVVAWMAGLLYLPRLFVYHAMAKAGSGQAETFKVMELRLYRFIMTPAMIATWVFGVALAVQGGWFTAGWFHTKLALVIALSGLHGFLGSSRRRLAAGTDTRSPKFYRIVNEIPTVLLILIVVLAVVKPF